MMRRRWWPLIAIALGVAAARPADAQLEPVFRTRFGIALAGALPIDTEGTEGEPGGTLEFQIGVGDDPVVVSLAFGYSTFGGAPFQEGVAAVNQFELRSDWCPTAPDVWAATYQVGVGIYRMDRYNEPNEDLRFGMRAGVGLRWSPSWQTSVALVTAYNYAPDLKARTRQWITVGVELLRWSD